MSRLTIGWLAALPLAALLALPADAAPESGADGDAAPELAPTVPDRRVMPEIPADPPLISDGDAGDPAVFPDDRTPPVVEYDPATLPTPVRRLREQIIEAAASGDIERLRPIIDANGEPPAFSYNDIGDDPIEYLRSLSNDPEGREILAVLIEMLEAGYVHVGEGTPNEMYVWPYFAHYPVELLTGPQIVELLKIVYPGDYEDMKIYGHYMSYRVGLAPDGTWSFFLVGD